MTSPYTNRPTLTPKYVPPQRRHDATPSSQQYLNYEDLHTRYSPPNSPFRMPRVQRSLSIEDLRQRFKREQDSSQGQDSPGPPPPSQGRDSPELPPQSPKPESPPPPLPRDFEALRGHGHGGRSFSHSPPPVQRPFLSPRFPDPPVFNGSGNANILFEDWKLRIQDKLIINKDHYPSDHSQIAYIITRLGGKAIEHTLRKRRASGTNYHSAEELLNQLSDIYEPTQRVIDREDRTTFHALEQGDRPFPEFYSDFMKHAPGYFYDNDEEMVWSLRSKLNYDLQMGLLSINSKEWSFPKFRDHVMQLDHCYRTLAARKAKKKAERFAKQIALASMEAKQKKPGKYAVIPRPDPEEFRR